MTRYLILFFTIYTYLFSATASEEERVKVVFFLDRSPSMKNKLIILGDLAGSIVNKLNKRCSQFSLAVSELEYGDIQSAPKGIIGYPAFVTEDHPNPVQELKNRILAYLPQKKCIEPNNCTTVSADHVGTREFTYSSVITTLQMNRQQIFNNPIKHLATLVVTDAAPLVEPYTVEDAVNIVQNFIPLDKFSNTSLSHENWSNLFDPNCSMDMPYRMSYTPDDLKRLTRFSAQTKGFGLNICDAKYKSLRNRLKSQIDAFLNEVILKGCLLLS